jgi:hypothetical protein
MVEYVNGARLSPALQAEAKRRYPHRYTLEHAPAWARSLRPCGRPYPVQFRDDSDWLANTEFPVTKAGALAKRPAHCRSAPTWPNGKD